ncbi:hypothetical protein AAVH_17706 [Aphelenchoides avenae]|nr:hypothetical protein AAVH_17706 [Aphelenchus avenae]
MSFGQLALLLLGVCVLASGIPIAVGIFYLPTVEKISNGDIGLVENMTCEVKGMVPYFFGKDSLTLTAIFPIGVGALSVSVTYTIILVSIPIIVVVVPVCFAYRTALTGSESAFLPWLTTILSFIPVLNPIATVYFVKSYRNAVIQVFIRPCPSTKCRVTPNSAGEGNNGNIPPITDATSLQLDPATTV